MSYLVSCLLMPNTIMTEKLARRGTRVPAEYAADFLDTILVRDVASTSLTVLRGDHTLKSTRVWLASAAQGASHQGFPIINESGHLLGVLTRRNLLDPAADESAVLHTLLRRPPTVVFDDSTLREAADHMVNHDIGRLPVMSQKMDALSKAVESGDVKGAQEAYADIKKTMAQGPGGGGAPGGSQGAARGGQRPGGTPPAGGQKPSGASGSSASSSSTSSSKTYDAKDANKDGKVSTMEEIEYDLTHEDQSKESSTSGSIDTTA